MKSMGEKIHKIHFPYFVVLTIMRLSCKNLDAVGALILSLLVLRLKHLV